MGGAAPLGEGQDKEHQNDGQEKDLSVRRHDHGKNQGRRDKNPGRQCEEEIHARAC